MKAQQYCQYRNLARIKLLHSRKERLTKSRKADIMAQDIGYMRKLVFEKGR